MALRELERNSQGQKDGDDVDEEKMASRGGGSFRICDGRESQGRSI